MPVSGSSVSPPPAFRKLLTEPEASKNSTLQSFERIVPQLEVLAARRDSIDVVLDVGCNGGGFAAALGEYLDATTVYGIDVDEEMRERAAERGLTTFGTDVESEPIPLEDDSVDLVVSFGLIEHLRYCDNLFAETARILRDGWFWVATPNLGSWINRVALLTGHQPRNVELSGERAVGLLPVYKPKPVDHVHAPTYKALLELLEHYGFDPVETAALTPYQRSRFDALLDRLFSVRTAWARRVSVLARQSPDRPSRS